MNPVEGIKRSNFPMTNDVPSTKNPKSAEQGSCNDPSNCRNENVKKSTLAGISTSQMSCLMDTPVSDATENSTISGEYMSVLVKKRSKNFEAHLQLINEKFGKLRKKHIGIFIKLFTDNDDMHRQLISFLTANNIEHLKPKKWIEVVIKGLPSDTRTQHIKEALIEKDLDVENIIQMADYRTEKSLPLFKVILPQSVRNKKIFHLTELLDLNVTVKKFVERRFRKLATNEKGTAVPKADVQKCVNCGAIGKVVSVRGHTKFRQVSKTNLAQVKTRRIQKNIQNELSFLKFLLFILLLNILLAYYSSFHSHTIIRIIHITTAQAKTSHNDKSYQKELPGMNSNVNASESPTDFQGIYARKEFRKLFGKYKDDKKLDQQLRKAKNAVENSRSLLLSSLTKLPSPAQSDEYKLLRENCTCDKRKKVYMNSNMDDSELLTDLHDITYVIKEFRKIFENVNASKAFVQQLKKSKNSVGK